MCNTLTFAFLRILLNWFNYVFLCTFKPRENNNFYWIKIYHKVSNMLCIHHAVAYVFLLWVVFAKIQNWFEFDLQNSFENKEKEKVKKNFSLPTSPRPWPMPPTSLPFSDVLAQVAIAGPASLCCAHPLSRRPILLGWPNRRPGPKLTSLLSLYRCHVAPRPALVAILAHWSAPSPFSRAGLELELELEDLPAAKSQNLWDPTRGEHAQHPIKPRCTRLATRENCRNPS